MENLNALGNIQFGGDYILFSINPEIYSLEIIKEASLDFSNKACIILDGNPKTEILVELRPKDHTSLKQLAEEFNKLLLTKSR